MSRIHPECPGSNPSDRSAIADVGFREEPDEEEDDEEEKKDEGDTKKGMMTTKIADTRCERAPHLSAGEG